MEGPQLQQLIYRLRAKAKAFIIYTEFYFYKGLLPREEMKRHMTTTD